MKFDEIIKEKLAGFEAPADDAIWQKVEGTLNANQGADVEFKSALTSGIAASILIAGMLATLPPISDNLHSELNKAIDDSSSFNSVDQINEDRNFKLSSEHSLQVVHEIELNPNQVQTTVDLNDKIVVTAESDKNKRSGIKDILSKISLKSKSLSEDYEIVAAGIQCPGSLVAFVANGASNGDEILWVFDGITVKEGKSVGHVFNDEGVHQVNLIIKKKGGKSSSISKAIEIFSNPTSEFSWSSEPNITCFKQELKLNATPASNTFKWILDGDTIGKGAQAAIKVASGPHVLSCLTINELGCSNLENVNVQIPEGFKEFRPSSFTPLNGDGINDTWFPTGLEDAASFSIKIVRVNDNLSVFETNTFQPWDGSIQNSNARVLRGEQFLARIIITDQCGETQERFQSIMII